MGQQRMNWCMIGHHGEGLLRVEKVRESHDPQANVKFGMIRSN